MPSLSAAAKGLQTGEFFYRENNACRLMCSDDWPVFGKSQDLLRPAAAGSRDYLNSFLEADILPWALIALRSLDKVDTWAYQ